MRETVMSDVLQRFNEALHTLQVQADDMWPMQYHSRLGVSETWMLVSCVS